MAKKAAYQAGSKPSHLMCFLYLTCLPIAFGKRAEVKAFKVKIYNFLGRFLSAYTVYAGGNCPVFASARARCMSFFSFFLRKMALPIIKINPITPTHVPTVPDNLVI